MSFRDMSLALVFVVVLLGGPVRITGEISGKNHYCIRSVNKIEVMLDQTSSSEL